MPARSFRKSALAASFLFTIDLIPLQLNKSHARAHEWMAKSREQGPENTGRGVAKHVRHAKVESCLLYIKALTMLNLSAVLADVGHDNHGSCLGGSVQCSWCPDITAHKRSMNKALGLTRTPAPWSKSKICTKIILTVILASWHFLLRIRGEGPPFLQTSAASSFFGGKGAKALSTSRHENFGCRNRPLWFGCCVHYSASLLSEILIFGSHLLI